MLLHSLTLSIFFLLCRTLGIYQLIQTVLVGDLSSAMLLLFFAVLYLCYLSAERKVWHDLPADEKKGWKCSHSWQGLSFDKLGKRHDRHR